MGASKKSQVSDQSDSSMISSVGDVSLLVAVGYDGGAVAFSVLESNRYLDHDLANHEVKVALWPTAFPTEPGLYLFTGQTSIESCGEVGGQTRREAFHHCNYTTLTEGLAPAPRTRTVGNDN